jgi:hypothetical protein
MNLEQIGRKYKISDSFLNSKEDAFLIAATSIDDLISKVQGNVSKVELTDNLKKLSEFLRDVKNSSF